jgi:hypothetical protein
MEPKCPLYCLVQIQLYIIKHNTLEKVKPGVKLTKGSKVPHKEGKKKGKLANEKRYEEAYFCSQKTMQIFNIIMR